MGEKGGKGNEKERKGEGEKEGGWKKEGAPITVVMKVDMHCEGCTKKIKRAVKGFEGVEKVTAEIGTYKLTVIGKLDPIKIRDRVESKTRNKVDLISPTNLPKKNNNPSKDDQKTPAGEKNQKKPDEKKAKEPAVSTVVLKIQLHCEGCTQRIRKTILRTKGVKEVSIDSDKDLVTVKGTMDAKSLAEILREKMKRVVEVMPAKKDGGEKTEKGGGGEKKKGKTDGEKKDGETGGVEVNKMDYYGGYDYRMVHAPQLFSDENPNACSIM